MFHIGVDLGGTNIKIGIIDFDGAIIASDSVPTNLPRSAESVCDDICSLILDILSKNNLSLGDVVDIGVGCPGTCNPITGVVEYANNLRWNSFPLRDYITNKLNSQCPVYIENDANVAAIGEFFVGSAKGCESTIVITIGTGLGSGAIINSKLITGRYFAGGEFGHTVIAYDGRPCTCGRNGCLEAYASASALIELTKEEMQRSPASAMWQLSEKQGKVSGRTAFDAMRLGDAAGAKVVDEFISYLACGVANFINAMQPEVICIGGGVCNEGDALLLPLREKVLKESYGMTAGKQTTELRICSLGNNAGIIGAAMIGRINK